MGSSNVFYFVFLLILFFPVLVQCSATILNDDVLGLIVFKADLRDPYGKLASWNEDDEDPCGWTGIKCDPRTNRVVELSLDGLSLSGKIGRGLLQLQFVQKLSLSRNNFSGGLNPKLSQLESLRSIDLSSNSLSGPIPEAFFAQCRSLRFLSLGNNGFSGSIPTNVGACTSLASLNFSSNRLSGSLPDGLWSLHDLRSLDLSGNDLSGEIPKGIGQLSNLRTVDIRQNKLSGRLPDDIGSCLLLKSLDLSGNELTGSLPTAMQKLSSCSYLRLGSNSLSGEVPWWIGELRSLEVLDLSVNGFSSWIPDSIGNLQLLRILDFSQNHFTGSLPETIGSCQNLIDVDFSDNSLTGDIPMWIFQLQLQRISLSGNKMTGPLPDLSANSQPLKFLDLSRNAFSGRIPVSIGTFQGLQYMNLSWNMMSGDIPASIMELKSLEVLDLSSNRISGSIPSDIGDAVLLKTLVLEKNSLTGEIPMQIGNCSSLTSLILSQNNLSGEIPPTLGNATSLQIVDISHNNLSGTLPKQLSNLPNLVSFNISYNLFTGDLPAGNFFNTIPPSSVSGNPGLCGAVVNSSCRSVLPKPIVLNPNSSSSTSSNPAVSSDNLRHKKIIFSISALIAIAAAVVIALGVVTITILNMRVRVSSNSHSAAPLTLSDGYYSNSPETDAKADKLVMFSGNDLGFSAGAHAVLNKDCELGRGGFGTVYKTILGNNQAVAIKKLTVSSLVKSLEDFEREVRKLGKLRHANLVALEGYYWTPTLQLLIYEFVSGGSLYKLLHECSNSNPLLWQERFNIIFGIARSLAYLHRSNIIHYNLKSSNILVGDSGEAKIGDYGLAKLLPMLDRYVLSSKVQSALGYMAPEFACRTVKITEKCDIYGFGVLLLEIVTGRQPVEYMDDDVVVLCDVVRSAMDEGRSEECVDGRLGGKFPVEEAVPVLKLGLICTSQVPSNRPDMGEVVKILELIRCPQDSHEEDLC